MKTQNRLVLSVYVPALILSFGEGILTPVLPIFVKSFEVPYGIVGLVIACAGIGQFVSDIPSGMLLRRFGRRPTMVVGVCLVVASAALLFWTQSVAQIAALRFASGVGGALWNVSRHSYLAEVVDVPRRGRAIAVFGGVNRIGGLGGPAIGGVMAVALGIRAPFLLYAALGSVVIVTTIIAVEASSVADDEVLTRHPLFHLFTTVRDNWRTLVAAGSGQLFAQTIRSGRRIIVPLYAADMIGLDIRAIGWIVSASAFVDMALFYPAGHIMDRYGRKWAIVPCFLIQAVGMGLVAMTSSFWQLLGATLVMGLGNGIGSGTMMTLGADLAPRDAVGEYLGVWRLIGDGGQFGGPMLVGGIADIAGLGAAGLATSGVGFLAGAIFALCVPETLNRNTPDQQTDST